MKWAMIAGGALLFGLFIYFNAPAPRTTAVPQKAPEFSLPDLKNQQLKLSSFQGKVVLLDFWATWCEPCLEELPDLIRFHETYKDKGFTMLGVAMDAEGASVVGPFVKQNRIPYPIVITGGELPDGFPVPGFPAAFLIDRDGTIVRRYLGPKSYEELEKDLAKLIDR